MKKEINLDLSDYSLTDIFIQVTQGSRSKTKPLDLQNGPVFITANHIDAIKPYINNPKINTYVLIDEVFSGEKELEEMQTENVDYTKFSGRLPNAVGTDQSLHFATFDFTIEDSEAVQTYRNLFQYLYVNAKKSFVDIEYDVLRPNLKTLDVYRGLSEIKETITDSEAITNKSFPGIPRYVNDLKGTLSSDDYYINVRFSDPLVLLSDESTRFGFMAEDEIIMQKINHPLSLESFETYKYHKSIKAKKVYGKTAFDKNRQELIVKEAIHHEGMDEKMDLIGLNDTKKLDQKVLEKREKLKKMYVGKCLTVTSSIHFQAYKLSDFQNKLVKIEPQDFIKDEEELSKLSKIIKGSYRMKNNKKQIVLVADKLSENMNRIPNLKYVIKPG